MNVESNISMNVLFNFTNFSIMSQTYFIENSQKFFIRIHSVKLGMSKTLGGANGNSVFLDMGRPPKCINFNIIS